METSLLQPSVSNTLDYRSKKRENRTRFPNLSRTQANRVTPATRPFCYRINMSRTLVLNISESSYEELLRVARNRAQSPERFASEMIGASLSDSLLRLAGCGASSVTDLTERLDEYLGAELLATHDE
jgi:hypothetical protein